MQVRSSQGSSAWARTFAVLYDPFVWVSERAGLRARRNELLSGARGCTLEIGSGTGLNLPHYPDDLDELVLAEPDPAMRSRLEDRLRRSGRRARLVDAPAERLPFADGSVDTVVSTFVLCTVADPILPCARSRGFCGPTVSCCSSSTSARLRRRSRPGRTAWRTHGVASPEAVAATARPRNSS